MILIAQLFLLVSGFLNIPQMTQIKATGCSSYQCSASQPFCISLNSLKTTYFVSPCQQEALPYCNSSKVPSNVTCSIQPKLSPSSGGYPGEFCSSNKDCIYGRCISEYCFGQVLNQSCKSNLECNPGLRCSKNLCTTLLKPGKSCTTDFDCVTTAGCNNGICTAYFSLSVNKSVSDCTVNHQSSLFCESGSCAYDAKRKTGFCIGGFVSTAKGRTCSSNNDCIGQSGSYIKNFDCQCGMNWNGTKYCAASDGDDVAVRFRSEWKNFMNAGMSALCNTQRRFDKDCLDVSFGTYRYEELMKAYYSYHYFAQLQNTSSCVQTVFFPALSDASWVLPVLLFIIF